MANRFDIKSLSSDPQWPNWLVNLASRNIHIYTYSKTCVFDGTSLGVFVRLISL